MKGCIQAGIAALALGTVAGCVPDPRMYETEPVEVPVSRGVVTCQLYTQEMVYWDRAIDWPKEMRSFEADEICKDEGWKWKKGERAAPGS